eukprot:scaffold926_cov408-Prasinococcus_capsulatus_cf.AAC.41
MRTLSSTGGSQRKDREGLAAETPPTSATSPPGAAVGASGWVRRRATPGRYGRSHSTSPVSNVRSSSCGRTFPPGAGR